MGTSRKRNTVLLKLRRSNHDEFGMVCNYLHGRSNYPDDNLGRSVAAHEGRTGLLASGGLYRYLPAVKPNSGFFVMRELLDTILWLLREALGHKRELLPIVSFGLLLEAGYRHAPVWVYADILILFVVMVLICNPFGMLTHLLSPATRICLSMAIFLSVSGIQLPDTDLKLRVCLVLMAAVVTFVAVFNRKTWLEDYHIKQSPYVDRAIAYLCDKGIKPCAQEEWEEHGAREARALLHQALMVEVAEPKLQNTHRAVYMLGYLHGEAARVKETEKVEKQLEELEAQIGRLREENKRIEMMEEKLSEAKRHAEYYKERSERVDRVSTANFQAAQTAKAEVERLQALVPKPDEESKPQNRDEAILAYYEAGHSYLETGEKFGLTKSGAQAAVRRAKTKMEDCI
jgi:coenzyme F420-reducing hydrogenase delta subunit